jgi:hypothetical protein
MEPAPFRGYVNLREGNEHSRVIDVMAANADEASQSIIAQVEPHEALEQVVSLAMEPHEIEAHFAAPDSEQ